MVPIRGHGKIGEVREERTQTSDEFVFQTPQKGTNSEDHFSPPMKPTLAVDPIPPATPVRNSGVDGLSRGFRLSGMAPLRPLFPKPGE